MTHTVKTFVNHTNKTFSVTARASDNHDWKELTEVMAAAGKTSVTANVEAVTADIAKQFKKNLVSIMQIAGYTFEAMGMLEPQQKYYDKKKGV